jgi:hypothetical protein
MSLNESRLTIKQKNMNDLLGLILNPILFFTLLGLIFHEKKEKKEGENKPFVNFWGILRVLFIIAIILYFVKGILRIMIYQINSDGY